METRATYCRICEAACGLLADVEHEQVVRLRPDPDHVVSKGFACAKGTRFTEVHQGPDRVNQPLIRVGGELQPTGWDAALRDIGERVRRIREEHGPHSVGIYIGNPPAFNYSMASTMMAFAKALGTRNHFNAGSLDCNNKFVVAKSMLGSVASQPVPDLDHANFALLIGTNPSVSQSSFVNAPRMVQRLQQIEARGGRVVVVDPRRTETARVVGTHLPINPDTDAALLLALLNVVFSEKLTDARVLGRHAHGERELEAAVAAFSPERVATATGIQPNAIRQLARDFAAADGAFCHVSTGVNQGNFGTIAYAAKIALELATGNLDRRGGALLPHGALDMARLARLIGLNDEPAWRSRIGDFPTVMGALPSALLADEILTPGEGQIRALIVAAGNPLLSAPDGGRLRAALEKLELLVSIDLFVNDTAAYASHVLPCTDWLEREDLPLAQLQLQPVPYLQWTDPVVPPTKQRRPEWRIFLDLAKAMGLPLFGNRAADLALRAALAVGGPRALVLPLLVPVLGVRPLETLRKHPHGLRIDRERPGSFLERRIASPGGKVQLFPDPIFARLAELEASLDQRHEPDTLRLITKRERLGHNTWMHANAKLQTAEHRAHLSPGDAERLGIQPGDRVRLSTPAGSIELPVELNRDVVPGAVAVPHGYGHEPGSGWADARLRGGRNVNELAPSGPEAIDPLTGMCRFIGVPVRVERAATAAAHPDENALVAAGK